MLLRGDLDCSLNSAAEARKVANERAAVCRKVLTIRLTGLRANQGKFVTNCLWQDRGSRGCYGPLRKSLLA